MITLVVAVSFSIGISALCSLLESVLYSTQAITLESTPKEHRVQARTMRLFKQRVERPLSAILILNTVANTAGAALAGWAAGEVWGAGSLVVFSLAFTLAILFFSEIIPKTVGAVYWRGLWRGSLLPLKLMMLITAPLIVIIQFITRLITRGGQETPQVSEEEILAAARLGAKEGEISHMEQELIANIIKLEDVKALDIMTPRTVIFSEDGERSLGEVAKEAQDWPYTRVPVYVGGQEDVMGYVLKYRVLAKGRTEPDAKLKEIIEILDYVPATANALSLLNTFLRKRAQLCLVVDEYGGIEGLITLEDVLETMVGAEIVDESDLVDDMQELARLKGKAVLDSSEEG
jgi:CBS domain containing-hemolysin-like protein